MKNLQFKKQRLPLISALLLILILVIYLIVFFAFKECHQNAYYYNNVKFSDRHCLCNDGYIGNGKDYCEICGLSNKHYLNIIVIQEYVYEYRTLNDRNIKIFNYSKRCSAVAITKNLIITTLNCVELHKFTDHENLNFDFIENSFYRKLEDTLTVEVNILQKAYQKSLSNKRIRVKKLLHNQICTNKQSANNNNNNILALLVMEESINFNDYYPCLQNSNKSMQYFMIHNHQNRVIYNQIQNSCSNFINNSVPHSFDATYTICDNLSQNYNGAGLYSEIDNVTYLNAISIKTQANMKFIFIKSEIDWIRSQLSKN